MKIFTFLASFLAVLTMNSQTTLYQENFDSYPVGDNVGEDTDIPEGFISFDLDGDGFNWGLSHPDNFYQDMNLVYTSNFMMSASYITEGNAGNGNQGSVNAHNILVLPMISIPEGSETVELSYYVGAGTSHNFFSETYYITATTSNEQDVIMAANPIFYETLPTPEGRYLTVSLEDFIGQDIYIAFRHKTNDQWMLGIDDIKVESGVLNTTDNFLQDFSYFMDTDDQLNLKSITLLTEAVIYNMLGQTVVSEKLQNMETRIDLSFLPDGIYVVQVLAQGKEKTFKILKN